MQRPILAFAAIMIVSASAAHNDNPKIECSEIKEKIRYVHSRMRAGYTRAEGEKLEAELRKLRVLRAEFCR